MGEADTCGTVASQSLQVKNEVSRDTSRTILFSTRYARAVMGSFSPCERSLS